MPAAPARGVLGEARPGAPIEHRRLLPAAALAPWVAHVWEVRWDLVEPLEAKTLPHPCVHLTGERPVGRAEVSGVQSARFTRALEGAGRVVGIKLRPGAFQPLLGGSVGRLRDVTLPLTEALGPRGDALAAALLGEGPLEEIADAAEAALLALLPPMPAEVAEVRDLIERIEGDRGLRRVEDLAALTGWGVRALERRFLRLVGAPPKWVLRRYRLIDAAERLKAGGAPTLAELALELGYFDQSHFARDFKALVGCPPSALL